MSGAGQPDAERRGCPGGGAVAEGAPTRATAPAVWGRVPHVLSHFFLLS